MLNRGGISNAAFRILITTSFDFDDAVIEREGQTDRNRDHERVDLERLAKIDPAAGGGYAAQVDALRLLAIFLKHWITRTRTSAPLFVLTTSPSVRILWRWCRIRRRLDRQPQTNLNNWKKTPI